MSYISDMGYAVEKESYFYTVANEHNFLFVNQTVIVSASGCEHQDWNHVYIHLI